MKSIKIGSLLLFMAVIITAVFVGGKQINSTIQETIKSNYQSEIEILKDKLNKQSELINSIININNKTEDNNSNQNTSTATNPDNSTNTNTLLSYFNTYKRTIAKLYNNHNARIIADFVYNKYKNKLSSSQWMHMSNKLLTQTQMNIIRLLHHTQYNKLRLQRGKALISKIYKVFVYIKLLSLFNVLQRKLLANSKDAFMQQLYTNYILYIRKRYTDAFRTYSVDNSTNPVTCVPPLTTFKHCYRLKPKRNNDVLNESKNRRLLPYLVEYLTKLKHSKLKYAYSKIAYNFMQKKFTLLYYAFHKKQLVPLKKQLLLNMKKQEQLNKFNELIKRKIIRNVQAIGTKMWGLLKVFYLLRLTNMHKTIALDKFLKTLVRKWRLTVKMAIVKRRQLMEMEKNFVETYVKIADGLFGDGNLNDPGIQMQVRDFIDKVHK